MIVVSFNGYHVNMHNDVTFEEARHMPNVTMVSEYEVTWDGYMRKLKRMEFLIEGEWERWDTTGEEWEPNEDEKLRWNEIGGAYNDEVYRM